MPDNLDDLRCAAEYSNCRTYRYVLWVRWAQVNFDNQVLFIGMNPSTAATGEYDPTTRRCIQFAKAWGYGGMLMMNAFAFRATNPKDMQAAPDPVGPDNDEALACQSAQAGLVIAAWGAHCPDKREREVRQAIAKPIHCLGLTKHGKPKHPLYLKADTMPVPYWTPEVGERVGGV
jgi:hypothetical protein